MKPLLTLFAALFCCCRMQGQTFPLRTTWMQTPGLTNLKDIVEDNGIVTTPEINKTITTTVIMLKGPLYTNGAPIRKQTVWPHLMAETNDILFEWFGEKGSKLEADFLYDFTTNWTTTNATEHQTLLRNESVQKFNGGERFEWQNVPIFAIERIEQQSGTVTSNVFVLLYFKGHKQRVDLESTPVKWPATQTVTNHSETKVQVYLSPIGNFHL